MGHGAETCSGVPDLTPAQAAAMLGVTPRTVRAWLRSGRLRSLAPEAAAALLLQRQAKAVRGRPRGKPFVCGRDSRRGDLRMAGGARKVSA